MAHILIVEDDQDINDLIARNLKLVGHTYRQILDGAEAVKAAEEDIDATVGIAARTVYPAAGVSVFTTSPGKDIAIPIIVE